MIMNNLVNQGISIIRSDEPSHTVAEVGDWKRSLLTRPWGDITVDISEADDRSHIEFTFDFRKMYSSVLVLFIVVYLVVVSIGVFVTGLSHWPFQPLGTRLHELAEEADGLLDIIDSFEESAEAGAK